MRKPILRFKIVAVRPQTGSESHWCRIGTLFRMEGCAWLGFQFQIGFSILASIRRFGVQWLASIQGHGTACFVATDTGRPLPEPFLSCVSSMSGSFVSERPSSNPVEAKDSQAQGQYRGVLLDGIAELRRELAHRKRKHAFSKGLLQHFKGKNVRPNIQQWPATSLRVRRVEEQNTNQGEYSRRLPCDSCGMEARRAGMNPADPTENAVKGTAFLRRDRDSKSPNLSQPYLRSGGGRTKGCEGSSCFEQSPIRSGFFTRSSLRTGAPSEKSSPSSFTHTRFGLVADSK